MIRIAHPCHTEGKRSIPSGYIYAWHYKQGNQDKLAVHDCYDCTGDCGYYWPPCRGECSACIKPCCSKQLLRKKELQNSDIEWLSEIVYECWRGKK